GVGGGVNSRPEALPLVGAGVSGLDELPPLPSPAPGAWGWEDPRGGSLGGSPPPPLVAELAAGCPVDPGAGLESHCSRGVHAATGSGRRTGLPDRGPRTRPRTAQRGGGPPPHRPVLVAVPRLPRTGPPACRPLVESAR